MTNELPISFQAQRVERDVASVEVKAIHAATPLMS